MQTDSRTAGAPPGSAPPGGSAYRMLKEGEIIQEGDYFMDDAGMWRKTICAGQPAPNPAFTAHRQYKRWLDTPNAPRMSDRRITHSDNMPRKQTATRDSGSLDALVIQRLLRKWKRKSKEFGKQVRPEWEHGDRYASRRYEGESIALRWCAEDLEAALYNDGTQRPGTPDGSLAIETRKPGSLK